MRVLVTQTETVARKMVASARVDVRVTTLMGGEPEPSEERRWDIYPEDDAILIGTQDMLLSRALNRGYAMGRYRWPIPFGLLNNDSLWVVDEPQLFGAGLPSTAQLQALRARFGTFRPTGTLWLSATLDKAWLKTVDITDADIEGVVALGARDLEHERVKAIRSAPKSLARADCSPKDPKSVAKLVRREHRPGSRTLVILNTVQRARAVFAELHKGAQVKPARRGKRDVDAATVSKSEPALVLVHSQFRPRDRRAREQEALAVPDAAGSIVITTQVIEAGVDLTSTTLFTDLAPWASLVQRFGRCNRMGEHTTWGAARIFWLDAKPKAAKEALPYDIADLDGGRDALRKLGEDASPAAIAGAAVALGTQPLTHVVRARDVLDLFDTTPDLNGADVDVSRFIREADDRDVQVFWRDFDDEPGDLQLDPEAIELCPAPIVSVRERLAKKPAWRWDLVEGRWERVRADQVYPGLELLLRAADGGYEPQTGWRADSDEPVPGVALGASRTDRRDEDDPLSRQRRDFQTLLEHSSDVAERAARIARGVGLAGTTGDLLVRAARYHDAGKAHEVFQRTMAGPVGGPWAKSKLNRRHERRGFRHELVSALMALQTAEPDLLAYLVASHHGKVRLKIRSSPTEKRPPDPSTLFARGVWHGERLVPVDLGDGLCVPETTMNLEYMLMGDSPSGTESWTSRVIRLRDAPELGPFRLAYLEALLRAADERASGGLP
jgi:CRISPR-associated endonuclease/helicase Cas3